MNQITVDERLDCIEMKRRIQEEIYAETREMTPDEFLTYIHKQVQASRFATLFAVSNQMRPVSDRDVLGSSPTSMRVNEARAGYGVPSD